MQPAFATSRLIIHPSSLADTEFYVAMDRGPGGRGL